MNTHRARYSLYHLQSTHSRWRSMWDFLAFIQKLQCCQGHFYLEMCQISSKGLHVNADHIRKMRYILKITIEHTIQNTRSIWIEIYIAIKFVISHWYILLTIISIDHYYVISVHTLLYLGQLVWCLIGWLAFWTLIKFLILLTL